MMHFRVTPWNHDTVNVMGTEPRVSHIQEKCSSAEQQPRTLYIFIGENSFEKFPHKDLKI